MGPVKTLSFWDASVNIFLLFATDVNDTGGAP
jgi:hypothetical protein